MGAIENKTVRDLAVEIPGAARVFEKLAIDYCCGGDVPLNEACAKRGLRLEDVVSTIERCQTGPAPDDNWSKTDLGKLAQHIVRKHHAYVQAESARLEALFVKVCAAHGENHPELGAMQATFRGLVDELRSHMMKEEHILFPYIVAMERAVMDKQPPPRAMFGSVQNPVRNMMHDHDAAGEALRALRSASHGYAPPADGCGSYRELFRSLEAFEADLHTHIHLENNILFPRALEMEAARGELKQLVTQE